MGNNKMKLLKRSALGLAVVAALGSTSVIANDTTSAIRGVITGKDGSAVTDAVIKVIHVPTGRVTTVNVNEAGNFTATGLRVGGPYKLVIDSDKYKDAELQNIFLKLGETFRLAPVLDSEEVMETIAVTGSRVVSENRGSGGYFGLDSIQNTPSVDRDLKEVLRLNPLVNIGSGDGSPMSIAGANPRYNSFSVDGVRQNDDFGLNDNGYPTQRSPISVDAVEQVSVNVTPYSAKNSGFSGGQVNAVTKSGTNEFHGTFFIEKKDDSMAGDVVYTEDDETTTIEPDFSEDIWGFTVGGPIIEDKLFFFASYESYESTAPLLWGPAGSSAPNVTDATLEAVAQVQNIASSVYGVDAGDWNEAPKEEDKKTLVKVDWNINDDHRLSATYQNTKGNSTRNQTSGDWELRLNTHWYDKEETLDTLNVALFSDWSSDLSTELKISTKSVETKQAPARKEMGDVLIYTQNVNGRNGAAIAIGPDQYRHGNELSNDTLSIRFVAEYLTGDHAISAGFEHDDVDVRNLFAPNSLGRWEFNSIEDFENGDASRFYYNNAYTNNVDDAAAKFSFGSTALFVEDAWALTPDLEVTAGLRYETIHNSQKPAFNQNFFDRYGFGNDVSMDGTDIFLPRVSFVWDYDFDTVVRGGIGRFSGGRPNVWISNAYSNDGITYTTFNSGAVDRDDYLTNVDITSIPASVQNNMVQGDGNVNVTDPDFEMPSDLRMSLSVERNFDLPMIGEFQASAEFIHVQKENDVAWVDLTRKVEGTTSDGGRNISQATDMLTGEDTQRYDLMLTNAESNGESNIFTTTFFKAFDSGVTLNMSYTNQDITEGFAGTSSTATSNYRYAPIVSRNVVHVGRSDFEVEHRFVLNLGYTAELISGYDTKFNLFFERKSGRPFTWTMGAFRDGDLGDQGYMDDDDYYLPYIPTGADDPNLALDGITYAELAEWIDTAGLSQYAGGYAPKNTGTQPWQTRMDIHIEQEIPGFVAGHKGSIYFDIKNVLNLLDEDSGIVRNKQYNNQILVDYDIDDQGRHVYQEVFGGFNGNNYDQVVIDHSAWLIKAGFRYQF